MKEILVYLLLHYLMFGAVFTGFVVYLAKRPTCKFAAFEFFCWPHRVVKGFKAIRRDAGKLDL